MCIHRICKIKPPPLECFAAKVSDRLDNNVLNPPVNAMPDFVGLPNEILLQIINDTSAADITSLASCCMHVHLLARGKIAFFREKRAQAEDIVVGYDMWETSAIHPSKHLQDILEDEDSRFYTSVMKVGSLQYGDPDDDEPGDEGASHVRDKEALIDNVESQYGPQITALMAKVYNALLPHAAKTNLMHWKDEVIDGDPAAVVILLLALYPNLKTLHIYEPGQEWWKEEKSSEAVWGNLFFSLPATAMEPATNTLKIFSKLSDFRLIGLGEEDGLEANAKMVPPFMALPTMRSILGRVVDGRDILWPYGTGTSAVVVLDLESDIDTASLSNLIRGVKALKYFRYQFSSPVAWSRGINGDRINSLKWGPRANDTANDTASNDSEDDSSEDDSSDDGEFVLDDPDRDDNEQPRWEPRAITATLLQYASNTLISLDLAAAGFRGAVAFPTDEPFIGSLRSFQVLKHVCLDTMMLFKKVKCFGRVSLIRRKSIRQKPWEEIRIQWLVDFLPESIESLEMTSKYVGKGLSKAEAAAMFTGLPELRDRVPNLAEITIERRKDEGEGEKEGWEELSWKCEENLIELLVRED